MARRVTTDPAALSWAHLDRMEWPPTRTSVRSILAKNVDDLPILFWIEMSLSPVLRNAYCGAVTEMCGVIRRGDSTPIGLASVWYSRVHRGPGGAPVHM